jgi:hypothetical protein
LKEDRKPRHGLEAGERARVPAHFLRCGRVSPCPWCCGGEHQ